MTLRIPADLLPRDGRFGSGPSKVPAGRLDELAATGASLMGTSHRQAPVKQLVRRVVDGLAELFSLPDGYEVVIGNGGSAAFWDLATYALIEQRSQHAVFGEFGGKFATAARKAPWLGDPTVLAAEPGGLTAPAAEDDVDAYAWTHNETSTGSSPPSSAPPAPAPISSSWSTRPRRRAGSPSTSPRPTPTTSPRRSRSPPTAACG